jgi:hypothetical protein
MCNPASIIAFIAPIAAIAFPAENVGQRFRYFAEERMHQIGNDQTDRIRPSRDQSAGCPIFSTRVLGSPQPTLTSCERR